MREPVAAFWCRVPSRPNFGDALAPYLIAKITGSRPRFVEPEDPRPKYIVTGSIIDRARARTTVWGAGIMTRTDRIDPAATLCAVRGPLTRMRALACGVACPERFGDPALLLPRFYTPAPAPRAGIGLVPHFSDMPRLSGRRWPELRLIDIQDPIERVIDQIAACELVASSSLHGIIAAHAYGIPAVWLKFRDLPSGDDSKFVDYQLSLGITPCDPVRVTDDRVDPATFGAPILPPSPALAAALWDACPLR